MGTFFLCPPAILLEKAHEWHSASTTTWPDTGLSPSLELEPHQTTNPIRNWERTSRNHSVLGHHGNQTWHWLLIPPPCSPRRLTPTSIWIFHPTTLLRARLQLHTLCSPNKICCFQPDKDVDQEHFCKALETSCYPKPCSTNTGEPSPPHSTSQQDMPRATIVLTILIYQISCGTCGRHTSRICAHMTTVLKMVVLHAKRLWNSCETLPKLQPHEWLLSALCNQD